MGNALHADTHIMYNKCTYLNIIVKDYIYVHIMITYKNGSLWQKERLKTVTNWQYFEELLLNIYH